VQESTERGFAEGKRCQLIEMKLLGGDCLDRRQILAASIQNVYSPARN
jgi:hypothetical protein